MKKNLPIKKDGVKLTVGKLSISENEIGKYQQQGIESFKKDYLTHCSNLKNTIELGMSHLKVTQESMKSKNNTLKDLKNKKEKLNKLLKKME